MKRLALVLLGVLLIVACATLGAPPLVLYAQSLPTTKHLNWTQSDLVSSNVTNFVLTLDGVVQNVPTSACTGTSCVSAFSIGAFGNHTVSIAAQNLALSTDPTSLQSGPAMSVSFSLNKAAGTPTGATVTN